MSAITLSILLTLAHGAYGWEGPRKLLGIHALTSSFLNEMKKELFQQQLLQLISSDSVIMIISSKLETKMSWSENHHTFNYICLVIIIYSCAEIYSTKPLKKLATIPMFVGMARQFRIVVATMFMVFFRAVENAI
jgi:hypothetical protein